MKNNPIPLLLICIITVLAVVSFCSPGPRQDGQVHEYDWDKVNENLLNEQQPPGKVMDALGVTAGMKVAEVGAGGGRYVVKMAERVGEDGIVYATDIAPGAVKYLKNRMKKNNIKNVEVIFCTETDSMLPSGILDLVYMTYTYRHLSKPYEVLENIRPSLNKTGILAIMETKPEEGSNTEQSMLAVAERAGYRLDRIETFLEFDNIWVFKPADIN